MTQLNPKREALAFRIWQYANSRNWDVTYEELADHLDTTPGTIQSTIRDKGWQGRITRKIDRLQEGKAEYNFLHGRQFDDNLLPVDKLIR